MARPINDAGLALIKRWEDLETTAYPDVAGIWTIGYGHIKDVHEGMVITEDQAEEFLQEDLAGTEGYLEPAVASAAQTTDNQYAAMVSLCFNIGWNNFKTSTVLRMHLQGNYPAAADAFRLWDKAHVNGVLTEVPGLLDRRNDERALYLTT